MFRTFSGFGSYRFIIAVQNYGTDQIAFAIAVLGAILACRFKLRTYEFLMGVKTAVFVGVNRTVFIIDVIDARQSRFAIRRFGAEFAGFFRRDALFFRSIRFLALAVVADDFGANQTVFARSICQTRLSFVERNRTNLRPGRSRQTHAAQAFFVCIASAVGKTLRHAQIAAVGGIVGRAVIPCAAFFVRNACAYICRRRASIAVAYIGAPSRARYARFAFARNAIAAAARQSGCAVIRSVPCDFAFRTDRAARDAFIVSAKQIIRAAAGNFAIVGTFSVVAKTAFAIAVKLACIAGFNAAVAAAAGIRCAFAAHAQSALAVAVFRACRACRFDSARFCANFVDASAACAFRSLFARFAVRFFRCRFRFGDANFLRAVAFARRAFRICRACIAGFRLRRFFARANVVAVAISRFAFRARTACFAVFFLVGRIFVDANAVFAIIALTYIIRRAFVAVCIFRILANAVDAFALVAANVRTRAICAGFVVRRLFANARCAQITFAFGVCFARFAVLFADIRLFDANPVDAIGAGAFRVGRTRFAVGMKLGFLRTNARFAVLRSAFAIFRARIAVRFLRIFLANPGDAQIALAIAIGRAYPADFRADAVPAAADCGRCCQTGNPYPCVSHMIIPYIKADDPFGRFARPDRTVRVREPCLAYNMPIVQFRAFRL